MDFQNFTKIKKFGDKIFENLSIHLGSCEAPQKICAQSVHPFWRLLDTNRLTNYQTDRYISYKESIQIDTKIKLIWVTLDFYN